MWNRIKNCKDVDAYCRFIDDAWEEYTFIFQLEATRVNFPAEMIWVRFWAIFRIIWIVSWRYTCSTPIAEIP